MKPSRPFSRFNFTLLALLATLAGTLFFTGCATTDSSSSDTRNSDYSGHQHHH